MLKFYDHAPGSYGYAFTFLAFGVLVRMLVYVLWVSFRSYSSRRHDDVHGTAYFATREEVQETGLLPYEGKTRQGACCRVYDDAEIGKTSYLRHDGPEYALALAPARSDKGVGLVTPTLLNWPHLALVPDCKGENYAMISGQQQKHANNVILRFDPAKPGTGCARNPLDGVQCRIRFRISDAQGIIIMAVDLGGKGIESDHSRNAAFELPVGLIPHTPHKGDQIGRTPCLQDTGRMLTSMGDFAAPDTTNDLADDPDGDPRTLVGLFDEMCEVHINDGDPANREAQIVITGVGVHMANTPTRELGSIIPTASNAPVPYRDPAVGENASRSGSKIADLVDYDRPVSFYFISTPEISKRLVSFTRLLLTIVVLTMADEMEFDDGWAKAVHKHRLLLMLDKFPTLGKIEVLKEVLVYIAGYDMKTYIITQSVSQLYKAYIRGESIISNCHVRAAYTPNKFEAAKWMPKTTGNTIVVEKQMIISGKWFGVVLDNMSRSYREARRPLMEPDRTMRLPGPIEDASDEKIVEAGEMPVLVASHFVIRGCQILYFTDLVFSERSKLRPVPADMMHRVPGQPVVIALAPEDEATNQRGGFVAS